jgi:hypothetical protein
MTKLIMIVSYLFILLLGSGCTSAIVKDECKNTCLMNNYTYDSFNHPMCECAEKDDPKETIYNP